MEYRYHPIYKYIAFYIILYAFLRHQKVMENNVLLVNSFFITIFVMIVDQMFIANNLTIFQPLSDQYFDSTPISVVKQELEEIPIDETQLDEDNMVESEKDKTKKKKKSKKSTKSKKNNQYTNNKLDLNNEDLYHSNDDDMYYNQYFNEAQQQKPERYVDNTTNDIYGNRGYDFQEPTLNNDYNFSVEAFNS
jgi:hypothetical protein